MKHTSQYIIFFLFLTLTVSCDFGVVEDLSRTTVFYPLSQGNVWQYDIYSDAKGESDQVYVLYVAKDTSISFNENMLSAYVVESFVLPQKEEIWYALWGHDVYGNVMQYGARYFSSAISDSTIKYKKTPFVGEAWDYNHLVYRSEDGFEKDASNMVCVQLDTMIVTKAGVFRCTKYDDSYNHYPGEVRVHYVSSEIGLIKSSISYDGEILRELSLRDYEIE